MAWCGELNLQFLPLGFEVCTRKTGKRLVWGFLPWPWGSEGQSRRVHTQIPAGQGQRNPPTWTPSPAAGRAELVLRAAQCPATPGPACTGIHKEEAGCQSGVGGDGRELLALSSAQCWSASPTEPG